MKSNYGKDVRLTDTRLRTELLKYEHDVFKSVADDVGRQLMAAVVYSVHLKLVSDGVDGEYRKSQIRRIVDDVRAILEMPDMPYRSLNGTGIIGWVKKEYGIDLDAEIKLNLESEKEYLKRMKD